MATSGILGQALRGRSGIAGALNLILVVRGLPASDLEKIGQRIGEWLAGPGSDSIAGTRRSKKRSMNMNQLKQQWIGA